MKKQIRFLFLLAVSVLMINSVSFAADIDLKRLGDGELKQLYEDVKTEMINRGLLSSSNGYTLREGKFIVGEDILPGTYVIRCTETDGEKLGDTYSSLGAAFDSLGGEKDGTGALMGALGSMMSDIALTEVEILGDYGSVLKSFELKSGESSKITLEEKTAIRITGGTCTLERQ